MSFVLPARARRRDSAAGALALAAPSVAVLGAGRGGGAVAAALALRLAAAGRSSCALLAGDGGLVAPRAPAAGAASRAARALQAREITACASGRLVRAELGDAGAFARADAVVGGPAVLLLSAPRTDALDELLRTLDALVLLGGDGEVADLALTSLRALGPPVLRVRTGWAPLAAALALAGLAAPAPFRAAVGPVLEAVS